LQRPGDEPAIRFINESSFEGSAEADLVEQLQRDGSALVSCVALANREVVGHILFSRVVIEGAAGRIPSVALAPIAVLASYRRQRAGWSRPCHPTPSWRWRWSRVDSTMPPVRSSIPKHSDCEALRM
jgi:predicted N-acetyltransferase YhbS